MSFFRKIFWISVMYLIPWAVFAQDTFNSGGPPGLKNPLQYPRISAFLSAVLKLVAEIAFPILVLFLVYIGFLFVTAQGNSEKITEAKKYLWWAIIGSLLILGASVLSQAIQGTVNQIEGKAEAPIIHFV